MAGFAMLHVVLNWGRLTGYARFRINSLLHPRPATERRTAIPRRAPSPAPASASVSIGIGRGAGVRVGVGEIERSARPPPWPERLSHGASL